MAYNNPYTVRVILSAGPTPNPATYTVPSGKVLIVTDANGFIPATGTQAFAIQINGISFAIGAGTLVPYFGGYGYQWTGRMTVNGGEILGVFLSTGGVVAVTGYLFDAE
jgi:hypothetical protein